jgi:hypothetical protein
MNTEGEELTTAKRILSTFSILTPEKNKYNEKCYRHSQCFGSNIYCNIFDQKFKCKSSLGFGFSNEKCLPFYSSEFECESSTVFQDADDNYECVNGKCKCKIGLALNAAFKCAGNAKLGEIFKYDYDCYVPNSFCGESKVCVFDDRYLNGPP